MDSKTLKEYRTLRVILPLLDKKITASTGLAQTHAKVNHGFSEESEIRGLWAERKKCAEKCSEVEMFIAGIGDCLTKGIFQMRYVDGMPWRDIAQQIGGDNTSDAVRMCANRYLKKC